MRHPSPIQIIRRIVRSLLVLACLLPCASIASAQFLGYTSPQTWSGTVLNGVTVGGTTPTGAGATNCPVAAGNFCQIQNLGQNVHFLTYTTSGTSLVVDIRLEGSIDGTTWFPISADATNPNGGALCAVSFYPVLRVNLVKLSGSAAMVTANYAGTSSTSGCPLGTYNPAQQVTNVFFTGAAASSNQIATINTPFGNVYGSLVMNWLSLNSGSGNISVSAINPYGVTQLVASSTIATGTAGLTIPLPPFPTSQIVIQYLASSTTGTINAAVVFQAPPEDEGNLAFNITTATNATVKGAQAGVLFQINVNQVGSSTATAAIYDGNISGGVCTGTLKGTVNVGTVIGSIWENLQFNTGLCITTTGSTPADLTVIYR